MFKEELKAILPMDVENINRNCEMINMKEKIVVRFLIILLVGIIVGLVYVVYYNIVTYSGEIELYIKLISYSIMASAGVGMICCVKVVLSIFNMIREDKLAEIRDVENKFNTEIPQNLINDIKNGTAADEPGQHGEMIMLFAVNIIFILCSIYGKGTISLVICIVCTLIFILEIADYCAIVIKLINTANKFHQGEMLGITSLPFAWFEFQVYFIRESVVMYIYHGIFQSENLEIRILMISLTLIFVLMTLICHFIYIYSFVGLLAKKVRIEDVKEKMEKLTVRELQDCCVTNRCSGKYHLTKVYIFFGTYLKRRIYAVRYLLLHLEKKAAKILVGLMDVEQLKKNTGRFCKIVMVSELVILDFILATNLNPNDPCALFFNLISTLVIIPVAITALPGKR